MLASLLILFLLAGLSSAQESGAIRLIVQGDDMGAGHGVNIATWKAFKEGILRSTNVLAPGAWMPEAAKLLDETPGLDVGVHLTLTSEWERVKWRPLTCSPTLVDANGYFFPMVWPNKSFPPGASVKEAKPDLAEIEKELRAQIELSKRMIPRVSYLWPHMGFDSLSPRIHAIVVKLSREYAMPVPGADLGIRFIGQIYGPRDSGEVRAAKLAAKLASLGPGTWLMVDHAATDTPEIQAFGHTGYENVAADRSAVVEAWTSPQVLAAVRNRGIKLGGYHDFFAAGK